ncbi:prolyl oligopeptidase family serine peptidase [Oscillatoria laete-virens NRMC-F 0139]|nr:prolyl oligopeptidase family serine peptidase [Oscillatoria laete-virens]MDL5055209.1 prolyl oligopeptidase family serine peptidase [Oscillatoria laete-virens NRMC-F 0139]
MKSWVGFLLIGIWGWVMTVSPVLSESVDKNLGGGTQYRSIGELSLDRLEKILTDERSQFSDLNVRFAKPTHAVSLYQVTYRTVIPEKLNRPVAVSGLIAVPKGLKGKLPLLSYQHGTVFSRTEVPSRYEQSAETRFMIANFAAQGYVVIAADYLGKGISDEPEGYAVKDASVQACVDMLRASQDVLADLDIQPDGLFLSGWSQGGYNTVVFLRRLEAQGVPVRAAVAACAPNDLYLNVNKWIHVDSKLDVDWIVGAVCLLIHSYEEYYGLEGLSQAAIRPIYQDTARDLYRNKISWEQAAGKLPSKTKELLTEEFVQASSQAVKPFFIRLQENNTCQWRAKTPMRFYYGESDEVIAPYVATLPIKYQEVMGGSKMESVFAGKKANHRATFLFGIRDQKMWFDQLRGDK